MDAFYASVEQLDHPHMRGKPVLVGGNGRRGVVGAASYEARVFGCRSAMPMGQARALCPHAIIARPRFHRYRELSDRLMEIIESFTPLVEPLSLDGAFADVTGSERLHGDGVTIAKAIRARVRAELGLTCSVGVAPNKFVAKLGSDLQKPDGLSVLPPEGLAERLAPLAIERMWGVGPVTAKHLHAIGVRTFGDLQAIDAGQLENLIGEGALDWKRRALGEDDRPVHVEHQAKSVGHEQTFGEDLRDRNEVESHLMDECDDVAARLRRKGLKAGRLTIKIRFGDFRTITRSQTLDEATDRSDRLREAARSLFRAWADGQYRPVRLIGCSASRLSEGNEQLVLFGEPQATKHAAIDKVSDAIRAKFGKDAIARADVAHHRNERWTDREAPRGRE